MFVRSVENPIHVIGIGADGLASLTAAAAEVVAAAELLVGGERHLAEFPDHPAEKIVIKGGLASTFEQIAARWPAKRVVVLASGDPMFYGIGPLVVERFGLAAVRIKPAPSSIALAFARLGVSWQDARVVSAHGRTLDAVLATAPTVRKLAVLTDEANTPSVVARALRDCGVSDATAHIFERLGAPDERRSDLSLGQLAESTVSFDPLNLVIILQSAWPKPRRSPGWPDDWFAHRGGQITKAEVRAISLAKLGLADGDTVWDIGAGCGSVSIEAAALVGERGRVYAIERDPAQRVFLTQNLARWPAPTARVVAGAAPAALHDLPDPDAVFIGGGGADLVDIVAAVKRRLRSGGRLVVNLATLERLADLQSTLRQGWVAAVTQAQISRSADLAGLTRLAALNPVFIFDAIRREPEP